MLLQLFLRTSSICIRSSFFRSKMLKIRWKKKLWIIELWEILCILYCKSTNVYQLMQGVNYFGSSQWAKSPKK